MHFLRTVCVYGVPLNARLRYPILVHSHRAVNRYHFFDEDDNEGDKDSLILDEKDGIRDVKDGVASGIVRREFD